MCLVVACVRNGDASSLLSCCLGALLPSRNAFDIGALSTFLQGFEGMMGDGRARATSLLVEEVVLPKAPC